MQIRWTEEAVLDLERISDYLFEQTPVHAPRLAWQIYSSASELVQFPLRGRLGRRDSTRELVLTPLPYIVVYAVEEETCMWFEFCTAHSAGHKRRTPETAMLLSFQP